MRADRACTNGHRASVWPGWWHAWQARSGQLILLWSMFPQWKHPCWGRVPLWVAFIAWSVAFAVAVSAVVAGFTVIGVCVAP